MLRLLLLSAALASGCAPADAPAGDGRLRVVATTGYVADLARQIGGDAVAVEGLMGPGVDPHLYRPRESDVARLAAADLVLTHGLDLEGKMADVFAALGRQGRRVAAVGEAIPESELMISDEGGTADPHVWMDPTLWRLAALATAGALAAADPARADGYRARATAYAVRLDSLDAEVARLVATVPPGARVLVTAHDAFGYFGRRYGLDVRGLQGLSTASEAGTADVRELAAFIATRRLPAIFVETSVSPRAVEAVRAAVRARGFEVRLGGTLYSDALGDAASGADTYEGVLRHNARTIAAALRGDGPAGSGERPAGVPRAGAVPTQ